MACRSIALAIGTLLILGVEGRAQRIHRESFESNRTKLRLGLTDGQVRLLEHGLVGDLVHSGNQAERMVVRITGGSFCHLEYRLTPAMVLEELELSVWVYANRPGLQLSARVVLPGELDPQSNEPLTLLLPGNRYEIPHRWQRLRIGRPDSLLNDQQRLLQARRFVQDREKRTIDVRGAFVDQLILDIHSRYDDVQVWVDDVMVGPIVEPADPAPVWNQPAIPLPSRNERGGEQVALHPQIRDAKEKSRAEVVGDRLLVGGQPLLFRGVHRPQAPADFLKEIGINVMVLDWPMDRARISEAAEQGLFVAPLLPIQGRGDRNAVLAENQRIEVDFDDSVIFYIVGQDLDRASESLVTATAEDIRFRDPQRSRPITGDVAQGYRSYSRKLEMIGAHRFPLMTSLDLNAYQQWLGQRKNLGRPGTLYWTQIQTHAPEEYLQLVYGQGHEGWFQAPVGPQPEQIKLLTYMSLAAGYRGLVYSSDRSLAVAHQGQARHLQMALLNLELMLIEPFLAAGKTPISARTSDPNVKAAIFRHADGVLVLLYSTQPNAQFVVGQASVSGVEVIVENAPEAAHVFGVGLGEVRGLRSHRGLGGIHFTVPEFDTVAFVVLTTHEALFGKFQDLVNQEISQQAALWQKELASIQFRTTEEIDALLVQRNRAHPQARKLLAESHTFLEKSKRSFEHRDFRQAYNHASRSLRINRLVRWNHWQSAIQKNPLPVADPFLVSFYTLPEHYQFQDSLARATFGPNQIPSGNFEPNGHLDEFGWIFDPQPDQGLKASALLVFDHPFEGRQALELRVEPEGNEPTVPFENTNVEMISPPVKVHPGQIVRISGAILLLRPVAGSVDGAMVWDSLGGKTLAARFTQTNGWQRFVLYRPVSRSSELRVHLALTGSGTVFFDDLQVQVTDDVPIPIAGRTRPQLER